MKSMNMDKMFKKLETSHILAGLAFVVLVWALMNYSNDKATSNFASDNAFASVGNSGQNNSTSSDSSSSSSSSTVSASDLLPKDDNSNWDSVAATPGLDNVNLLKAGQQYGINTVGSSLRNANLQLRKDPPIKVTNVGPWNGTTMSPDTTGLGCT